MLAGMATKWHSQRPSAHQRRWGGETEGQASGPVQKPVDPIRAALPEVEAFPALEYRVMEVLRCPGREAPVRHA